MSASRERQTSRSCGARTAGSGSGSTYSVTRKRSRLATSPARSVTSVPWRTSRLRSLERAVALDELERVLRRREDDPVAALAEPQRPARATRDVQQLRLALVHPGRRHRASKLLQRPDVARGVRCEREDRLGVDGHLARARACVAVEQLVVVDDDPVVDSDHRAVTDRVVVRGDRRDGPSCSRARGSAAGARGREPRRGRGAAEAGVRCFTTVASAMPGAR